MTENNKLLINNFVTKLKKRKCRDQEKDYNNEVDNFFLLVDLIVEIIIGIKCSKNGSTSEEST